MRTQTLSNVVSLTYPDAIVQINDDNILKVNSLNLKAVGGYFTLTNAQSESVTLEYLSELTSLTFKLCDSLKKLVNGQHSMITVSGSVANGEYSYTIEPFTLYVEQGRTLLSRTAGNVRTMYWQNSEDLKKVNIYTPVGGSAVVGSTSFPLHAGVNVVNMSALQVVDDFNINVTLSYSHSQDPVFFGDIWHHASSTLQLNTNYTIKMVQISAGGDCNTAKPSNFGKIRFLNVDGCYVTFIGRVAKEKFSNTQNTYYSENIVVHEPNAFLTSCTDEVTMTFQDVDHFAYFYDIMWSTDISYLAGNGTWQKCILSSTNLTQENEDENNIECVFKMLI